MPDEHLNEEWRSMVGRENDYSVSTLGRIRRETGGRGTRAGKITLGGKTGTGYLSKTFRCNGKETVKQIHALVAAAFLGPRPPGKEVNHKNGIGTDNRVKNLEYITHRENIIHAVNVLGRHCVGSCGVTRYNAKLTDVVVRQIIDERKRGATQKSLADRFGVDQSCISRVARRKQWRHVS